MASYTVQPGDTLGAIARRYGVSISDLVKANGIEDPDLIFPGQTLSIPGLTPAVVSPPQPSALTTSIFNTFGDEPPDQILTECDCEPSGTALTTEQEEQLTGFFGSLAAATSDVRTVEDVIDLGDHLADALAEIGVEPSIVDDVVSLVLDLIPIVGDVKAGAQAVTGTDLITGDPLNQFIEGVFAVVGAGLGLFTAGAGSTAASAVFRSPKIYKHGKSLAKVADNGSRVLSRMAAGKAFEKEIEAVVGTLQTGGEMATQLRVVHPDGYKIVDGYIPPDQIFSMYHSQLADYPDLAMKKIDEAVEKYSPGTEIWKTKSGKNQAFSEANETLLGDLYLVVPDQTGGIPVSVVNYAEEKGVEILQKSQIEQMFRK